MDDPGRHPKDSDRSSLRDRIRRAVADGRISAADGDIRLRNVGSAQSVGELGLMTRELDQLEATIAPAPPGSGVPAGVAVPAGPRAPGPARRLLPVLVAVVVLGVVGAGVAGLLAFSSGDAPQTRLGDPVPITADVTSATPSPESSPAGAAYSLSPEGVRRFLQTYRQRFGTTRVVSATFYGDYVVVQVPIAGTRRHSGWVYRPAGGFTDFGGAGANFPGSAAVDLSRLDVATLFANIARAKRVLHVAGSNQTYVNIDYRPAFDPAPNVNVYLSNRFHESGYLATRLDGRVERAYPFGQ